MVKKVDEIYPDHIGWRLWDAAYRWKSAFTAEMVAMGHPWYAEARGGLLQFISEKGTRQAEIVANAGTTKQAVQQLLKELEDDGIVERFPDPKDGRGRIVKLSENGILAMQDAAKAKTKVESEIKETLGADGFQQLKDLLVQIGSDPNAS